MSTTNTLSRSVRGVDLTATEANMFTGSNSDGTNIYWQDTQLTAAQVNDLKDTNIEVVSAPAAGLAAIPVSVFIFHDHGGTDFVQAAGSDHIAILYNGGSEIAELGSEAQCTALVEASADAALHCDISASFVPVAATAIDMDNNGATDYTTGDGTFSVRVFYRVVPMAAFS